MKTKILEILLPELETKWTKILINYDGFEDIRLRLPTKPGIYQIRTNAPIAVLSKFPKCDKRIDRSHCNLKVKIEKSLQLADLYIAEDIVNCYVVYTGHQKSIRQRCKEHLWEAAELVASIFLSLKNCAYTIGGLTIWK